MDITIPAVADIQAALRPLNLQQLDRLAELSGVPAATIYKIRRGETMNPGMETVGKFAPHIAAALADPRPADQPAEASHAQ